MKKILENIKNEEMELKKFENEIITGEELQEIEQDIEFEMCSFNSCTFKNITAEHELKFRMCEFHECKFENVEMFCVDSKFTFCELKNMTDTRIVESVLRYSEFKNTHLEISFEGCDMRNSKFENVDGDINFIKSIRNVDCIVDNLSIVDSNIQYLTFKEISAKNISIKNVECKKFEAFKADTRGSKFENLTAQKISHMANTDCIYMYDDNNKISFSDTIIEKRKSRLVEKVDIDVNSVSMKNIKLKDVE